MTVPFYILIRPVVYLAAVILFWHTAKHKLDSRWRFVAIVIGLFVASAVLSVFDSSRQVGGVIQIGGFQVTYGVVKGFLENTGLFAIVCSLLMLLRKRLESVRREVRQLARIASSSADAIVGVDRNGAITLWNLGAEMVFGYAGEEMMRQRIRRLVADEHWDALSQGIARCMAEGFLRGLSCHMLARGRREIMVDVTLSAVTDDNGMTSGISLFMRDVTEQQELDQEMLHASKTAAVGTLASNVAGEFANLLTVISGKAALGKSGGDLQEAREAFAAIESCANRARRVTDNLTAFASRQPPQKVRRLVTETIDAAIESIADELEESSVTLTRRYDDVGEVAHDREQMRQVFVNLIANAAGSMRETGGNIAVAVACCREFLEIRFRDDGPSITADELANLFDPFSSDGNLSDGSASTNMSLFVCREIVKYHSGDLSVDCGDGATTVHVYLPTRTRGVEDDAVDDSPAAWGTRKSVAVVDSDAMVRDLLAQALERADFSVRTFPSPAAARTVGMDEDFEIVMVDISSRTPEGREYIEHLKENKQVSVVALVGEAMAPEDLESLRAGLAGCLRKPFGLREVSELMETFVAGSTLTAIHTRDS